jgi:hypothetical protein
MVPVAISMPRSREMAIHPMRHQGLPASSPHEPRNTTIWTAHFKSTAAKYKLAAQASGFWHKVRTRLRCELVFDLKVRCPVDRQIAVQGFANLCYSLFVGILMPIVDESRSTVRFPSATKEKSHGHV